MYVIFKDIVKETNIETSYDAAESPFPRILHNDFLSFSQCQKQYLFSRNHSLNLGLWPLPRLAIGHNFVSWSWMVAGTRLRCLMGDEYSFYNNILF